MEICTIASGSSGNCICTGTTNCHVLIDAGISGRKIENGLHSIGFKTEEMEGILVTHEHSDHVAGLGVLARRYGLPIYGTKGTLEAIERSTTVGEIDSSLYRVIQPDVEIHIGDLDILPVRISHDAADPVAYIIQSGGRKVGVITDLGTYDDYLIERMQGLDILLIEANHDVHMLEVGGYPYYLKQRILSDRGHLSNELSGQLLCEVLHDKMNRIILGHLSRENNYAELAYETVRQEIHLGDNPYKGNDFPIYVAKRDEVSPLMAV